MNWLLFITLGAACGWLAAGDKKGGQVLGSMAVGALGAVLVGFVVTFVFAALFFLLKVVLVIFGALLLLSLLGSGKSD
jgi:uncharacterized membrane protein YeaQ/YmgE (transglycosylase-associated protein family)